MVGKQSSKEMTLILGAGNIALGDEGFGIHVVRKLQEKTFPPNVRIKEGGVGGLDLLCDLEGVTRLIVVDVMIIDKPFGEVLLFKAGKDVSEPGKKTVSFHQLGILELIQIGELIGHKPEVYFLTTQPQKMEWSFSLTPEVQQAVEKAVDILERIISDGFSSLMKDKSTE